MQLEMTAFHNSSAFKQPILMSCSAFQKSGAVNRIPQLISIPKGKYTICQEPLEVPKRLATGNSNGNIT